MSDLKQPAITSKNLGGPPIVTNPSPAPPLKVTPDVARTLEHALKTGQGDAVIPDTAIEARPLVLPNFDNISAVKQKNKNVSLRWVNRIAPMRMAQMHAMGFVNATTADVDVPATMLKDGAIIVGDLILMKIARTIYMGALKHNQQKAVERLSKPVDVERGKQTLAQQVPAGVPPDTQRKATVFTPTQAEIDALVSDSSSVPPAPAVK